MRGRSGRSGCPSPRRAADRGRPPSPGSTAFSHPGTLKLNEFLGRADYQINSKNTLSFHYFAGQGNQVAPVGGSALSEAASELKYYYEVAPIHVSNYALVWNSAISTRWSNQVLAGVNYFRQIFNDFNSGFVVSQYGLVLAPNFDATGLTGAPNIQISGFDGVGQTPPEGRRPDRKGPQSSGARCNRSCLPQIC